MLNHPNDLKIFDTWHDFGDKSSNRSAQAGIDHLGLAIPKISQPQKNGSVAELQPRLGTHKLFRAKDFKIENCNTTVRMKNVSYERAATAALDSCVLENAWSYGKRGNVITWEQLFIKEGQPNYIDPATLSDVVVIANGKLQKNYYGSALKENNKPNVAKRRNIVGHWILKYMFPGYTGSQPVGVTFDAAGGKTVKVFSGIGQVKAIVTPQNISDSASTSLDPFADFKMFGHKRTEFLFPQNPPTSNIWQCQSTLYSSEWCRISFENVNYNTNSPNGFKIKLDWGEGVHADSFTIDYDALGFTNASGGGAAQGPSAPYLAGLINTIAKMKRTETALDKASVIKKLQTDANLKPDISTIIPLVPLIQYLFDSTTLQQIAQQEAMRAGRDNWRVMLVNLIVGLLFDFKRAGDYEQANAAQWAQRNDPSQHTILSTGDILCSTYSRSIKQPCILRGIGGGGEGGSAIALFRFPSAARVPNSKSYDFIVEMIAKMETIEFIWDAQTGNALQNYILLTQGLHEFAAMENPRVMTFDGRPLLPDNANWIFIERLKVSGAAGQPRNRGINELPNTLFSLLLKAKFHELSKELEIDADSKKNINKIYQGLNAAAGAGAVSNNIMTVEHVKDMCKYIMNLRQPLLKAMRDDNQNLITTENQDGVDNTAQLFLTRFLTDDAKAKGHTQWGPPAIWVPLFIQVVNHMMKTMTMLNKAVTDNDPRTLIIIKLGQRGVGAGDLNAFFRLSFYPLYNTADPSIRKLNLFFKDIGFNVPLFYKCWEKFVQFLNGMPANLNDITMVTDGGGSFVGRYQKGKNRISILNNEYKNETIRDLLFNGPAGISKLTENFESWFTNYRLAVSQSIGPDGTPRRDQNFLLYPCRQQNANKRRSSRNALSPIDECLNQQLSEYDIMTTGLYSLLGPQGNTPQPSCFVFLLQCLDKMENQITQSVSQWGGSRTGATRGGGNFPCLETGMAGRTRSPSSQMCDADVFIEVLNIVERIAAECNEFISSAINSYYLEQWVKAGSPQQMNQQTQFAQFNVFSTYYNLYQVLNHYIDGHTTTVDEGGNESIVAPSPPVGQLKEIAKQLQQTKLIDATSGTLEQINQLSQKVNTAAAMSLAMQLRMTILQQLQGMWTGWKFDESFLRLTNNVACGSNPGVIPFLFNIQQLWIDSLLKNLELSDDLAVENNTWRWTLLKGSKIPTIEFIGGPGNPFDYINSITNMLFLNEGARPAATAPGAPPTPGAGINGNNIFRFAQLHTIFSAYQNAFNPYTATNVFMSRDTAFQNAYNIQGFQKSNPQQRSDLPLYSAGGLMQMITQYSPICGEGTNHKIPGNVAFVVPSYYLLEKLLQHGENYHFAVFKLPPRGGVRQTPSWSPGTAPPITPSGSQRRRRRPPAKNKNAATARAAAAAAAAKRLNGSRSKKRKGVLSRRRHSPQSNYMSDGGGKRAHTKKRRRRRRNTKRREQRKQSKRRKRKQKKFTRRRRKR
jgi:hypothetical protein